MDIVPTLLATLKNNYSGFKSPEKVGWIGEDVTLEQVEKEIPLWRGPETIKEHIAGNYLLADDHLFQLGPQLNIQEVDIPEVHNALSDKWEHFQRLNHYVISEDKIIPKNLALVPDTEKTFTKEELIWIQSVFTGSDYDKAYDVARQMAQEGNWDRANLLCNYILEQVPRHVDAQILKGRLSGWQGKHTRSIRQLKKVLEEYPNYPDAYAALMDSYYWAKQNERVLELGQRALEQNIWDARLKEKTARSEKLLKNIAD